MTYYPDQLYASELMQVRRERLIPEEAQGQVRVKENQSVGVHDVIARGVMPSEHIILDAADFFGLKRGLDLNDMLFVEVGERVTESTVLAGKNPERGKRLYSPVDGIVKQIKDGRIIIQRTPSVINVEAGVKGQVTEILPNRGVVIETTGGHVQGAWGNGHHAIAVLRMEPSGGMEEMATGDELNFEYKGAIVLTRDPLTQEILYAANQQNIIGLIAPSMEAFLVPMALSLRVAVLLTEGFGDVRMSNEVYTLLSSFKDQQLTVDAHYPRRWDANRPSIVVNQFSRERVAPPNFMIPLTKGQKVRINRDPYRGQMGIIAEVPKVPVLLENGLRVKCATVNIFTGQTINIPLTDLGISGT